VLLIDDPVNPDNQNDRIVLENTKNLMQVLNQEFLELAAPYKNEYALFMERVSKGLIVLQDEKLRLSQLYAQAARWFKEQETLHLVVDHTDQVFVELTYRKRSKLLRRQSVEIRYAGVTQEMIARAYHHLSTLFSANLSFFERKQYQNLSHAPNKAMNVNSYLGLMGKTFNESFSKDGLILEECAEGDFSFANADYIAMLDADSVLSYDYAKKLIYEMKQKPKLAVIQTPPTAFPNPTSRVEEIAGATMDIQYYSQQGYTQFNATYWVGANAIARKTALDEIVEKDVERGYPILRYIQDRTVIEDTESSIDLVQKGWTLCNYPERLSYSSTPPDFGSLLIQRRRWANGGIIIIPKLIRYFFKRPFTLKKAGESIVRFGYLSSVAMWILGVCLFSIFPLENSLMLTWFLVTLVPYLIAYARDLKITGFKYSDVWRVMALNTVLIPVNAAGVMKSIQQAVTGRQIPFCRTPKVQGHTGVPRFYVAVELLMCVLGGSSFVYHCVACQWSQVLMSGLFFIQMMYGIYCFLGIKNCMDDLKGIGWQLVSPALKEERV
jgi:hypothetical protein